MHKHTAKMVEKEDEDEYEYEKNMMQIDLTTIYKDRRQTHTRRRMYRCHVTLHCGKLQQQQQQQHEYTIETINQKHNHPQRSQSLSLVHRGDDNHGIHRNTHAIEDEARMRFEYDCNTRLMRMDLLPRDGSKVNVNPDDVDILVGLCGMEDVQPLLYNNLYKPALVPDYYANTAGRLCPLHFAIVGRNGTGKRTAIRYVCSLVRADAVFITPPYKQGDLGFALGRASEDVVKPALVCIEDTTELMRDHTFVQDFTIEMHYREHLRTRFNRTWIAFCAETEDILSHECIKSLVGSRIAHVRRLDGEKAATLLMCSFMLRDMRLDEQLTEHQVRCLYEAADGASPKELKAFAGEVCMRAINRRPLEVIAAHAGKAVSHPTTDATLTEFQNCTDESITISWAIDAEPVYCKLDPEYWEDGVEKFTIPRL